MKKLAVLFSLIAVCDQHIYDIIYTRILQRAIAEELNQETMDTRNVAIENLRGLCRGQLSSYEKGEKVQ